MKEKIKPIADLIYNIKDKWNKSFIWSLPSNGQGDVDDPSYISLWELTEDRTCAKMLAFGPLMIIEHVLKVILEKGRYISFTELNPENNT